LTRIPSTGRWTIENYGKWPDFRWLSPIEVILVNFDMVRNSPDRQVRYIVGNSEHPTNWKQLKV
jgi:hypothetical protein